MPKGIRKDTIPKVGNNPNHEERPKKRNPLGGRPPIPIDWKVVDKYLMAGCSAPQVAAYLSISAETLRDRCLKENGVDFSSYSLEKLEKGNSQILGKQYQIALEGDRTMLVWLGKNRLKQSDKVHQIIETKQEIIQKKVLVIPRSNRHIKND